MKLTLYASVLFISPYNAASVGYLNHTVLNIAALVETEGYFSWMKDIFEFTISMINDKNDGWNDNILTDTELAFQIADPQCDDSSALNAYWDITQTRNRVINAVIGPRCSGGALVTGMLTSAQKILQVLYSASSSKISDKSEYPYVSRLVAPGDARGEVGGMVAMLQGFGWDRISIIATDSSYTKDYVNEFNRLWADYEISSSDTVVLNDDGTVNDESLKLALKKIPVNDPVRNSRVILLIAYNDEAYSILKLAQEMKFQEDTIWVGSASWIGRDPLNGFNFPISSIPGYIGLMPYRNRDAVYKSYMNRFREWQERKQISVLTEMPDYTAEYLVDSILAVAQTFSATPKYLWTNATHISAVLRSLSFDGISGRVGFTEEGDRLNPQYSIVNLQLIEGKYTWEPVGTTGTQIGSHYIESSKLCFAVSGCDLAQYPSDKYPVPPRNVDAWVIAVISSIAIMLVVVLCMLRRSHQKKRDLQASMSEIQKKMEAMQKIDEELLSLDDKVEAAKIRKAQLFQKRELLQEKPATWSDSSNVLVEVLPDDDQYWKVANELKLSMSDAHISKLWRVQNMSLWTYYSFHNDRLSMNGISQNEKNVWHGTSSTDPAVIYNDRQDGFMMQYSQSGFWGRGIYFAAKSVYSHSYAFQPEKGLTSSMASWKERPNACKDEREMFLTKLLVGNEININRDESHSKEAECRALTVPPVNPVTGLKYNTVTGSTGGSQVWIVYENGRAYPDYLVRYYRGKRDNRRTPFDTEARAKKYRKDAKEEPSLNHFMKKKEQSVDLEIGSLHPNVIWEFQDDGDWKPFADNHQAELEKVFQDLLASPSSGLTKIRLSTSTWEYEVDVADMVQENISHQNRKKRAIRRVQGENDCLD